MILGECDGVQFSSICETLRVKNGSRAALNPENRFQNGPIIAQVKGPKFKPKQSRVAFNHMVFPPAL